jgi:hypothetical protein
MLERKQEFVRNLPRRRQSVAYFGKWSVASLVVDMLDLCILLHQALSTNEPPGQYTAHRTVQLGQRYFHSLAIFFAVFSKMQRSSRVLYASRCSRSYRCLFG